MYQMMAETDKECRELLEQIWSGDDCWGDYANYRKCIWALNPFDRDKALAILRRMLARYELQMVEWAYLFDGHYMQTAQSYETAENRQIMNDLRYVSLHIPAYALLREGRTDKAEMLMNWLGRMREK